MVVSDKVNKVRKVVLIVDYFFPPLAGAAVQRTLGYVRHLRRFGWEPIVLTVRSGDSNFYDASLLEQIPESVDVQRTASFEPLRLARRFFTSASAGSNRYSSELQSRAGVLRRSIRRIRGLERWFFFPDRHIGWLPFAVAQALRANRRRGIDLIYSSSTVITSHVIAYVLKKILGKPWVADFQDPWANEAAIDFFPSAVHASLARQLETVLLRTADHVTVTTEPLQRLFERRDAKIPGKVTVIPMGYEAAAFAAVHGERRQRFTITHFGGFYAARSPGPFLEALGQCVREHPRLADDIEVLFLGTFDPVLRDLAVSMMDRWGLRGIVRLQGVVCYTAGLQLLTSSDVLLLVQPDQWGHSMVPAKLYEYLAARRPILALVPEGPAAEILREAQAGLVVPPDDVTAIKEGIWKFYRQRKEGLPADPPNRDVIERYAWCKLTGRLTSVFDCARSMEQSPDGTTGGNMKSTGEFSNHVRATKRYLRPADH